MNFKQELEQRTQETERILMAYLPEETGHQRIIMEAMNYSVMAGGKRLRPMLMKETYQLFGGNSKVIEPFMAAFIPIRWFMMICRRWTTMNIVAEKKQPMWSMGKPWGY